METKLFSRIWFSTVVHYLSLAWTIFCIIGTWFVILRYGIILKGLFAVILTFFFAASIWMVPFAVLVVLSLFVAPPEEAPLPVPFKNLIKKGMRRSLG